MNTFHGLCWDFSPLSHSLEFMDLSIQINQHNKIEMSLYEKQPKVHLYIPWDSVHPPGVLLGIVTENAQRHFQRPLAWLLCICTLHCTYYCLDNQCKY